VRRFWNAPRMATRPGLKAVELFDAVLDGRVKALWVLGTNPAASMPRATRVRDALAACPFVVVSDCWPTDTTALAEIVLPAAGWGEKDGTITNSERRISRQRAFRATPGEARPDWWMLTEVARRMGWEAEFPYRRPADIFREHAALSGFENEGSARRVFDIGALADLSNDAYDHLPPLRWPLPRGVGQKAGSGRLFGDGRGFPTGDGRARFVPTSYRPPVAAANRRRPLLLNTGRVRDQWHTMTRTGRLPRLMAHQAEPLLDIHPDDAAGLGLVQGGFARVESEQGETVLPVRFSTAQRPGEVFAAIHWTDDFTSAGPIARLVQAATDPVSGQPELKQTPVRVTPVAALWRGIVLRHSRPMPEGPYYWARVPLAEGHAFDLAGWAPLPSGRGTERWILELLGGAASPELVIYADPARGVFRYASLVHGRLDACLFLSRTAVSLPPRDAIAALLGSDIGRETRTSLLAGQLSGATVQTGPIICACFGVGLRTLNNTIARRNLTSIAEIGAVLHAGTNCGSCLPELNAILRRTASAVTLPAT
jgi:assimilatory nitrate reductase catalytic subunit